jgi:hypothetical protein
MPLIRDDWQESVRSFNEQYEREMFSPEFLQRMAASVAESLEAEIQEVIEAAERKVEQRAALSAEEPQTPVQELATQEAGETYDGVDNVPTYDGGDIELNFSRGRDGKIKSPVLLKGRGHDYLMTFRRDKTGRVAGSITPDVKSRS